MDKKLSSKEYIKLHPQREGETRNAYCDRLEKITPLSSAYFRATCFKLFGPVDPDNTTLVLKEIFKNNPNGKGIKFKRYAEMVIELAKAKGVIVDYKRVSNSYTNYRYSLSRPEAKDNTRTKLVLAQNKLKNCKYPELIPIYKKDVIRLANAI